MNTPEAQSLAYKAAVKGTVLLKNDGTLPLRLDSASKKTVALIGPWANATTQMRGNYWGVSPYLISPLAAATAAGLHVNYVKGTNVSTNSTSEFRAAIQATKDADVIIFVGGPDNTIEREGLDRYNISWPGNQLKLIHALSHQGKPLIVVQMGAGQCDHSSLKFNPKVRGAISTSFHLSTITYR